MGHSIEMSGYSRLLPSKDNEVSTITVRGAPAVGDAAPVTLHIYDCSAHSAVKKANGVLKNIGTGAYHAGVEVYGREWSFGSTEEGGSGVGCCVPGKNEYYTYVKAVPLGRTVLTKHEVQLLLKRLADEWQEEDYDLLRCNCCHF